MVVCGMFLSIRRLAYAEAPLNKTIKKNAIRLYIYPKKKKRKKNIFIV